MYSGELAALATAFCWTATALAFEAASRRVGSLAVNLIRLVLALALLTGYTALVRGRALPLDATPQAWLWLLAVQHTKAGVAATLMALVPVLILPVLIVVKRERISARAWIGAGVAVAGGALLFLS